MSNQVVVPPTTGNLPVFDVTKLVIEVWINHCPHVTVVAENHPLSAEVENVQFCTIIRLHGKIYRHIGDLVEIPILGN